MQEAFKRLDVAKQFNTFLGRKHPDNHLELTADYVLGHYKEASAEWGAIIARLDASEPSEYQAQIRSESKAGDNLASWLAGLHVAGEDEPTKFDVHSTSGNNARDNSYLYRCTYCNNPSAVLRKCS